MHTVQVLLIIVWYSSIIITVEPPIVATIGTKDFGHYTIEGWPQIRGLISTNTVGTKVSGHYREGGCSSGVAIKRDSTL